MPLLFRATACLVSVTVKSVQMNVISNVLMHSDVGILYKGKSMATHACGPLPGAQKDAVDLSMS